MSEQIRKAIIPAAGLGTRFLPATKAIPKEMLPIVDTPTIQLIFEEAVAAGIEEIILVNGRGKGAIEDHFDISFELERTLRDRGKHDQLAQIERISQMVRVVSVRQKEPLGLGHAILAARQAAGDEPVAVMLGDDLFDTDGRQRPAIGQLIDAYHRLEGRGVVSLLEVEAGQEHLYGIVAAEAPDRAGHRRITHMVEKPSPGTAPSRLAIVGRYVLPREIWPLLERTRPGKGGEIQLTDALLELAQRGSGCYGVVVDGERHDAGDRLGYLGACLAYALKRADLRAGLLPVLRRLTAQYV
ncbi:MAG TPA: UTP--glucose-1-phosphate uridylyltransferase [Polyangia bacterium]|jgi:UTP--glucose-1-phosphate uridylyltransferase|nr:UTP--glucose-1-phosphate uridylyltransferase [Polyangia bacterium]